MTIARIGNVTGHSKSGYSNYRNDHFWLFNQSCVQFGAYPDNGQTIEMTPVDVLARALGALALHPRAGLHVANLQNPARIGQREWFDALSKLGLVAKAEAPGEWQLRLAGQDASSGLALLREFYTGDLSWHDTPVEQAGTIALLAQFDIDLTADYARLIDVYTCYLLGERFFTVKEAALAAT
ncbi:SDR family oxidoreductase [Caballeronia sp. LZ033]|uniref:SDR family oxidoreductase n=1 Tax=Caballeronia sp. LZ033 TaxID=3038566 RepID=UPI00286AE34B|nr:SDR family oxidoreductase [Caballeronia sp. LZ033]